VEPLPLKHRRAAALIGLSVLVIAAAGTGYVYLTTPQQGKPTLAPAINPLLVTSYEVSYDFTTPQLGWAAMSLVAPSSNGGRFEVFQTTDGAKHWQPQFQSQSNFSGLVPFSVRLFGKMRGFMTVGNPVQEVYRTIDGGRHWDLLSFPPNPRIDNVAFSDPIHGWLLAASISASNRVLNLYSTDDGGNSWQRLPDPPSDANKLSFRSPTEAWLGSVGPGRPHVYTSRDAGKSWQRYDLPTPSGGSWDAAAGPFQVEGELLPATGVIMSALCVCAQSGMSNFTSFDGGSTWRYVRPQKGNVAYQDAVHWWEIDGRVLLKSPDAGQTWVQITDKLPDWHFLPHVLDSKHAWADLAATDGEGLGLTDDGGLDWTRGAVPQALPVSSPS
jgi:photosystem II stability/assembly factor-like uncharacterized protein